MVALSHSHDWRTSSRYREELCKYFRCHQIRNGANMRYSGWKPNCFDSHKVWSKPESACDIACCISHAEGCCETAPISMSIRIMLDDQTSKGPQTPVMSFVIDQGQSVALAVSKRDSQVAKGPAIIFWYGRSTTGMSRWVFVVFARSLASDEC